MTLVNITNRHFDDLYDEVWNAFMEVAEADLKELMPYCEGPYFKPVVKWPTTSTMTLTLARHITFVKTSRTGEVPTSPPSPVVRAVLEAWKQKQEGAANQAQIAYIQTMGGLK